jgi:hypothetical protein
VAAANFVRGHPSALLLEPGTSFIFFTESCKYPMLRDGQRTEMKRAEGATHILIVSVQ